MANYAHTTKLQFRNKVYQKLGKSSSVYWTNAEIDSLLLQAMLNFGAISGVWKDEIIVDAKQDFTIYDLFPFSGNTTVSFGKEHIHPNISSQTLFDWINQDLIESLNIDGSTDSEFLSANGILRTAESKYNLFQQMTALVIDDVELNSPALQKIIDLPDEAIDLVRVSYLAEDGTWIILDQADEEQVYQFMPEELNYQGVPKFYSYVYGNTKQLQLIPVPANTSKIALMFVSAGLATNFPTMPVGIVHLPNNLIPYLKFGILGDIFSNDGVWNDPIRAAYCKQRWDEGITVGRNYNSVYTAKVNGRQIDVDSVANLDIYQNDPPTPGIYAPTILGFAGFNMFALNVSPQMNEFSFTLLVNSNAPFPVNDEDFIKLDVEYIDTLADYVVHLAQMKTGAAELAATASYKDEFIKIAINHNRRLAQRGITFQTLSDNSKFQERDSSRTLDEITAQAASTQAAQGY